MNHASGWSRSDVLATLATTTVLGVVGVSLALADPSGRTERLLESLSNLRAIGAAMSEYRADNGGYLPLEMLAGRRPAPGNANAAGYCSWQFGGKNCNGFWFNRTSGTFDVEAADRPLNSYLYPEFTFPAPPPPQRMSAGDAARARDQARVYRDSADLRGRQENWPNPNPSNHSDYDSVGTSYLANMLWFEQIRNGSFVQRYNEGTRRLAVDQGVDPDRFVHLFDSFGDVVIYGQGPNSQIVTNHGSSNEVVTLFADAHASLIPFIPGRSNRSFTNETYTVWFEGLGRPAGTKGGIPSRALETLPQH